MPDGRRPRRPRRSGGDDQGRLLADLRAQYERLRRSVLLFRDLVSVTDTTALYAALLEGIAREFQLQGAFVGRVQARRGVVQIVARQEEGRGRAPDEVPIDHPLIARLLESSDGTLLVASRAQAGQPGLFYAGSQSLLAVRFRLEGDAPDLLALESKETAGFTGDDLHFVQDLLKTLEATLHNRYSRSRADRELDLLMEVTRAPGEMNLDLDEAELGRLADRVLEIALSLTRCRTGAVLVVDEETGDLNVDAETFTRDRPGAIPTVLKRRAERASGIVFRVQEDNRTYLANDARRDVNYIAVFEDTRASLAVPIPFQDRCIGIVLVEATEEGYFTPDHQRQVENLARTAAPFVRRAQLYQATRGKRGGVLIKGRGPAWAEVEKRIERASATSATVSLRGESGTGKELVAHAIHFNSARSKDPFVVVNCAAIPAELLESELFGHVKGAFTGAVSDRAGAFETADGGTIFLDEIGDLPPQLQVKLLRVLQSGDVRKVGSDRPSQVDVRVIAATSRDLETMMGLGRFREDLYYRLMVVPMFLPPLRDYPGSIASMLKQFVTDANISYARSVVGVSDQALEALKKHHFPGNVRELRNIVEQGVLMSDGSHIELSDLPPYLRGEVPAPPMPATLQPGVHPGSTVSVLPPVTRGRPAGAVAPPALDPGVVDIDGSHWAWKDLKDELVHRFEQRYLDALLRTTEGNVTRAAELAGIHRVNLHRMIKRHQEE